MVDAMKSALSEGMKWLIALVLISTAGLGYAGVLNGDQVFGIFMGVLVLAQSRLKGRESS